MPRREKQRKVAEAPGLIVATFDIETTGGFNGAYSRMLCCCFKFSNEDKPRTIHVFDAKDEKRALEEVASLYAQADVIVGWNSKLFDVPYVNARLMINGCKTKRLEPSKMHCDLMYQYRKLNTGSSRLANAIMCLKLPTCKIDCPASDWVSATAGDRKAYDRIVSHCENDVLATEEAFTQLKPYLVNLHR